MGALAANVQDPASSWWLSVVSLNRALERERPEFKDRRRYRLIKRIGEGFARLEPAV